MLNSFNNKNNKTMKKTVLLSIMLMAAFAAKAQLKVAPKIMMGDEKSYVTTSVINMPGQKPVTITEETTYKVAEVLSEGCVLSVENTKVTSDATADNVAGQLIAATQELMMGVEIRLAADMEGVPQRIVNFDEVKKKITTAADVLIDKMLKTAPQLAQMPKEALKAQITENATQENMLKSLTNGASPLALNGKTIMTGAQDEYVNDQSLKMKRMYFVNGNKVTTNSTMNMSKDEMKQLIIDTVTKMAPDQAEMIKQNIDQVMASGMVKIDMKETVVYDLQDDGWVKNITSETTNESMGQNITMKATVSLK